MARIVIPIPKQGFKPNYENALRELGADPVTTLYPVDPAGFDGLLLPGGGDLDPARYGQEPTASQPPDPELDDLQFAVARVFLESGKPIFGICRGMQLLNVLLGGTLIQNLPSAERHRMHDGKDSVHGSKAEGGSFLAGIYGESFPINSAHHQAVDRLGEGLRPIQWSDDGVVEAVCHETIPVAAVQWHPERLCFALQRPDAVDGSLVLQWFLSQCG